MTSAVTTDKKRLSLYVQESLKEQLEALAKARKRSVNNLIEILCEEAITNAKKQGEIDK